MRKVLGAIAVLLLLCGCGVAYSTFSVQSRASNNPETEEYYYNEEEWEKKEAMLDSSVSRHRQINGIGTAPIDTVADSVTVLVNKEFSLPADYVPEKLVVPQVAFNFSGYKEKKLLREDAAKALEELFAAADSEGLSLVAVSGYRSYERQKTIYDTNVAQRGAEQTNQVSAKPGYSEHQTGLAIDVSTNSIHYRLDEAFEMTPEGRFLKNHAYEYGFVIRYPADKCDITGYSYEPWHIRYVGKEMAKELFKQGITLEEYYNYLPSEELLEEDTYGNAIDIEDAGEADSE